MKNFSFINTLKASASNRQLHTQICACVLNNNKLATISQCNADNISCCTQKSTQRSTQKSTQAEINAIIHSFGTFGKCSNRHKYYIKDDTYKIE
jgi:hypothetical protein